MADFESIVRKHTGEDGAIPAEAVAKLIQAVSNAVGREFVEKKRYNDKLEEIDTLKGEKQTAEDSATTATKWKTKYDELKTEFDQYKTDAAAKETAANTARLFRAELEAVGITGTRADKIIKATDLTAYAVKDGAFEDAQAVRSAIKADWSDFIPTTITRGAQVETPPANTGGKYASRAEIMQIKDTGERQKAIAQNLDLFGH